MSTSESGKNAPHSQGSDFRSILPGDTQSVPAGLPDPAALARMANEFFTALPLSESMAADAQHAATVPFAPEALGAARNPTAFVSLPGVASFPSMSLPAASLPAEADLRTLPATDSPATPLPQVMATPVFRPPEFPAASVLPISPRSLHSDFSKKFARSFPIPLRRHCQSRRTCQA